MWIKRTLFERLMTEKARAEGAAATLAQRITAQDAAISWMQVRLTQLEYERAQLINNYMGIKLPVLEIAKTETAAPLITTETLLNQTVSFDDIGDEAAKAMGLDWDSEGRLLQHGKLVQ
jgi:hypothetical protein